MYKERNLLMDQVEALIVELDKTNRALTEGVNAEEKKLSQFKANFIKNLLEDILFLIDSDGQMNFCMRNGNLIIRNMVEQLIEFLYVLRHQELIEEYFGEKIAKPIPTSVVQLSKELGKLRFEPERKKIYEMAKDINQIKSSSGEMTLYDLYTMLSETCHNSYFISWLETVEGIRSGKNEGALSSLQIEFLRVITGCVLMNALKHSEYFFSC